MDTIHLVTITRNSASVFQFVVAGEFDRASYLAGAALDAMADLSPIGEALDYTVTPVPCFAGTTPNGAIYAASRAAVTW